MEEKTIYDLDLHESLWLKKASKDVLRVAGGWIYSNYDLEKDMSYDPVFVPYITEFRKPIKL